MTTVQIPTGAEAAAGVLLLGTAALGFHDLVGSHDIVAPPRS